MIIHFLALIGPFAVGVSLWIMGKLSKRLSQVTHARPYYRLLYLAALAVWVGGGGRLAALLAQNEDLYQNTSWIFIIHGLPAFGLTLALIVVWYYWSWLLAERD